MKEIYSGDLMTSVQEISPIKTKLDCYYEEVG